MSVIVERPISDALVHEDGTSARAIESECDEVLFTDVSDATLEAAAGSAVQQLTSSSPTYLRSWSICCAC